jgi:hypothetical protein
MNLPASLRMQSAAHGWAMAEFDDAPEGKAFAAEMEEMRAPRDDWS